MTQATSFQGGSDGLYREAQHAEMRQVARVEWNDLRHLLEGEAIVLFGGLRIYAKLFYAKVGSDGPIRLNVPLMLSAPASEPLRARHASSTALTDLIEAGDLTREDTVPVSLVLRAIIDGFKASSANDIDRRVTARRSTPCHPSLALMAHTLSRPRATSGRGWARPLKATKRKMERREKGIREPQVILKPSLL